MSFAQKVVPQRLADVPQNGTPDEFTVSGSQWFRQNNFTALPILLVNPVALYGYGDINIVPAVCHDLVCIEFAGMMHAYTDT
jgi:hypothetical protein